MSHFPSPTAEHETIAPVAAPAQTTAPRKTRAAVKASAAPAGQPVSKVSKATADASPARVAAKPGAVKAATSRPNKAVKDSKLPAKKPKLVRDSFTFPAVDYAQIGALKQRALQAGHEVKKSELLRAGLAALCALSDAALVKALQSIDRLKPGRPAK